MLSISSLPSGPRVEPAPRWLYYFAPCAVLLIGALLYKAQHRTNITWFRILCFLEFAVVILTFAKLIKKRTQRDANLFNCSWMVVSALTQTVHSFFLQ